MSTSTATVAPQHLHALRNQGENLELIDVRTSAEYRAGHASGAKLVPLDELSPETLSTHVSRPGAGRDRTLYLLCKTGSRARQAAERLAKAGYRNLALVDGGTEAWEAAGLPVVRAAESVSLERQVRIVAGLLVLLGIGLALTIHLAFIALSAFIGAGLMYAGITDSCGMGLMLAKMPWNQCKDGSCSA